MSSSKFVVKAVFGNDFRRFILREPSYDLLIKTLAQSYDLSTNFVLNTLMTKAIFVLSLLMWNW
jgi:hypothetical protein